jgi:hypothetical protein
VWRAEVVEMALLEARSIDKPDERRDFPNGHLEVISLPGFTIGRASFAPGWRWSESVQQIAGTDSCQFHHKGFLLAGHMHIRMNDGTEIDLGPGDAFVAEPGHDAWVVGDETVVAIDVGEDTAGYAKAT